MSFGVTIYRFKGQFFLLTIIPKILVFSLSLLLLRDDTRSFIMVIGWNGFFFLLHKQIMDNFHCILLSSPFFNRLCLIEFSIIINWTNPFSMYGLFGSNLQFILNFKSTVL